MVGLRREEQWAAGCVQAALSGVTIGQHDDNSTPGAHDLDLSVAGGRTFGAVEITAAANAKLVETWKLLNGRGERWIEPELAGGWLIDVRPDARINRLRRELPGLLRALENAGITTIPRLTAWPELPPEDLGAKLAELGVVSAWQSPTEFPGSIYAMPDLLPSRWGGFVASTGDALSEWLAVWIDDPLRSDNLDKLRRSAALERHLFVFLPGFWSPAPFSVNDLFTTPNTPLPTLSPVLPSGVTHVWVASTWANTKGIRWSPNHGWERFETDAVLDLSTLAGCTCQKPSI